MKRLEEWRKRRRLKKVLETTDNEITNLLHCPDLAKSAKLLTRYTNLCDFHDLILDLFYDTKRQGDRHGR